MGRFRYTPPKTITDEITIEGPGVCIDATGEYCTSTGALVSLHVAVPDHFNRARFVITPIDINALSLALGALVGGFWLQLDDERLAELLAADAADTEADWADWQNDMRMEAAE